MPEGGPDPDADLWLGAVRRAVREIDAALRGLSPAERAERLGRGAGGDRTMRVDRVAEDALLGELGALGRPLVVVSEEAGEVPLSGGRRAAGDPLVVVDPVDGSLNAARGQPGHSVSVAIARGDRMADVVVGVVADLATGEEYSAARGAGARLDGAPLPLRPPDGRIELMMLEGASPARVARAAHALEGRTHRIRVIGSLALSLCAVAAGRGDAMAGLGDGRPVDIAAAQLIAREAGVLVGYPGEDDLAGAPLDLATRRHVVAARSAEHLALAGACLPPAAGGG